MSGRTGATSYSFDAFNRIPLSLAYGGSSATIKSVLKLWASQKSSSSEDSDLVTVEGLGESSTGTFVGRHAQVRLERIKAFERRFVELAMSEHFEYGCIPSTENFVLDFHAKNAVSVCVDALVRVYWAHSDEPTVAVAALNALSALPYDRDYQGGQTLAVAATTNPNHEVKEAAIRVFERWGDVAGADILAKIECPWPWLDEYRTSVIADLKSLV